MMEFKIIFNDEVFFDEEFIQIGEFTEECYGEKVKTQICKRENGDFIVRQSFVERGNPDPSYELIRQEVLKCINEYLNS